MEDNQQNQISVTQALNKIQSWLNAGKTEKVIQGCQEILEIEPGSQRALSMMKQAEEKRHIKETAQTPMPESKNSKTSSQTNPNPEPKVESKPEETFSKLTEETPTQSQEPTPNLPKNPEQNLNTRQALKTEPEETPTQTQTPVSTPPAQVEDPLAKLGVEHKPEMFETATQNSHIGEKRKLFLAMLIPAVFVVVIGGGIIWFLADEDRTDTISEIIDEVQDQDYDYLKENEDRVEVLTNIAKVLEEYETEHGEYPSTKKVESIITDSDYFKNIPVDARQGEFDKSGKLMGYMYATYDTIAGNNTAYIVSALFEDNRGFGYAWTRGASTKHYEDYRDIAESHVVFIGGNEEDIETYDPNTNDTKDDSENDKTDTEEINNEDTEEPQSGPKVPTS